MTKIKKRKLYTYAKKLLTTISPLTSEKSKKKKINILNTYYKLTKEETNELISKNFVPGTSQTFKRDNIHAMMDIFKPIQMNIVKKKYDYSKILKLVPELEQASLIVIPSILSPNSFRNYIITYNIDIPDSILDSKVKAKIISKINNHANNHLKLNEKLETWIKEALYKTGAKPVLIIPTKIINKIRNSSISFESINEINESVSKEDLKLIAKEENIINIKRNIIDELSKFKKIDIYHDKLDSVISGTIEEINKKVKRSNLIQFIDNPDALVIGRQNRLKTNEEITAKYREYFSEDNNNKPSISFDPEMVVSLDDYFDLNNKEEEHPILEELPTESVIPLYIEGIPSSHIHYLVMLDENGAPINISNKVYEEYINTTISDNCSNNLEKLYKSIFGSELRLNASNNINTSLYRSIYETYLDKLIKNNLKGMGLTNMSISFNDEINKVMLYRLFKHKKTKLVFVPNILMMYFAFNYNEDGTGRSKLEDILFPLSLKITYLITKTINLMEQAIHRQNVQVDLDESAGNPLEILQAIKEKLIEGKVSEITYDPIKIIKNIAEREIRITPNNIPGINQFSISPETYTPNRPIPDDTLIEEVNNLINLNLDVPPSAFNRLNETEYSRSIVTNNILFAKKIENRQNKVIIHMSELIRSYLLFDTKFITDIKNILISEKVSYKGNLNDYVLNIIQHVTLSLPTLRISHDKADFEEINEYVSMIESLLDKLFPSDLIPDRDNQEVFGTIVGMLKADIIRKYLIDSHMFKYIDETIFNIDEEFDISKITDLNQFVANTKKALDVIKKKITKEEEI